MQKRITLDGVDYWLVPVNGYTHPIPSYVSLPPDERREARKQVSETLRDWRTRNHFTLAHAARVVGVRVSSYTNWEQERSLPSLQMRPRLESVGALPARAALARAEVTS